MERENNLRCVLRTEGEMKYCIAVSLLIALVTTVLLTVAYFDNQGVDSWLYKAQAAGNPAQAAEFLGYYKAGLMGRYSADQYYHIFRYPSTQFTIYYRVIDGLIVRASQLSKMDATETAYQMGLINLETDINDIGEKSYSGWGANEGWILMYIVLPISVLTFLILAGIVIVFW